MTYESGYASPEMAGPERLQQQAEMLITSPIRPDPRNVAELVQSGLTSDIILTAGQAAGYYPPQMDLTLQELPLLIDYTQQANDVLALDPRPKIYAARDKEYGYDDFVIRYPHLPAVLMKASGPLFSRIYKALGDGCPDLSPELVARWFSELELTDEMLREQPRTIVDTGFRGTFGRDLSNVIRRLRGDDFDHPDAPEYVENGLLKVKLLSARPHSPPFGPPFGTEILDSSTFPADVINGHAFPKTSAFLGRSRFTGFQPAAALASAVQLLPHHTQEYCALSEQGGVIESLPSYQTWPHNADANVDRGYYVAPNVSIVNPVAALIVQAEVVRSALAARTT